MATTDHIPGSNSLLDFLKRWRAWLFVALSILLWGAAVNSGFKYFTFVYSLEQSVLSLRFALRDFESPEKDRAKIVIVAVDDRSLFSDLSSDDLQRSPGARLMQGNWPWNRRIHGILGQRLIDAGARVVAYDFVFPTSNEGDWDFYEMIAANEGRVVLGFDYVPSENEMEETRMLERLPYDDLLPDDASSLLGFVNIQADEDGMLSRGKLRTNIYAENLKFINNPVQSKRLTQLAESTEERYSLGVQTALLYDPSFEANLPSDRFELPYINYGGVDYFKTVSYIDVILEDRFQRVADVFKDAIVLVGPAADHFKDVKPTPLGNMYGVETHAHLARSLLNDSFYRDPANWQRMGVIFGLSLVLLLGNLRWKPALRKSALLACLTVGYLLFVHYAFVFQHLVFPVVGPLMILLGGGFSFLVFDSLIEQFEKKRLRGYLSRYVSPEIAKLLSEDSSELNALLQGANRPIAVMFSDIRGFTTLSEQYSPEALVAHLNEYFESMVDGIHANQGSLNKYIGDAILAFWGGFFSAGGQQDCINAVETALKMGQRMERLNAKWATEEGKLPLKIGVGISFGNGFVGNLGHSQRMEFAVMGDVVNLGSRLEGATKQYGCSVLVSEQVYQECAEAFHFQELDIIQVKGKTKGIRVYAPLSPAASAPPPDWLGKWHQALANYRNRDFETARAQFTEIEQEAPAQEVAASLYIQRCDELIKNPPSQDWDFICVMDTK